MFVLTDQPRFTHDVEVNTPVDGGFKKETFKATYAVIDVEEIGDTHSLEGQKSLLQRVVVGLEDILDGNKKPVPYSDEFRDRLIGIPFIRKALLNTYLEAVINGPVGN